MQQSMPVHHPFKFPFEQQSWQTNLMVEVKVWSLVYLIWFQNGNTWKPPRSEWALNKTNRCLLRLWAPSHCSLPGSVGSAKRMHNSSMSTPCAEAPLLNSPPTDLWPQFLSLQSHCDSSKRDCMLIIHYTTQRGSWLWQSTEGRHYCTSVASTFSKVSILCWVHT